jgi:lipid-A-disaccharide synthase
VRELIQNDLNTNELEIELKKLLDTNYRDKLKTEYKELQEKLGGVGASTHAANAMLKSL